MCVKEKEDGELRAEGVLLDVERGFAIKDQFHQQSTGSFCTSRFMLILLAYTTQGVQLRNTYFLVICNGIVWRNFVCETEWRKRMTAGAKK
jgi:hypothetical protein